MTTEPDYIISQYQEMLYGANLFSKDLQKTNPQICVHIKLCIPSKSNKVLDTNIQAELKPTQVAVMTSLDLSCLEQIYTYMHHFLAFFLLKLRGR